MNHDSCSMKKVANEAAVHAGKPGSFAFEDVIEPDGETYRRMWAKLPDGEVGGFALEPAPPSVPYIWPWNGSDTKPTIKRPIRLRERWCGQIKGGRMISDPADAAIAQTAVAHRPPPGDPSKAA